MRGRLVPPEEGGTPPEGGNVPWGGSPPVPEGGGPPAPGGGVLPVPNPWPGAGGGVCAAGGTGTALPASIAPPGDAGALAEGAAAIAAPQLPQKRAPSASGLPHCGQNMRNTSVLVVEARAGAGRGAIVGQVPAGYNAINRAAATARAARRRRPRTGTTIA
jgi:hypothetical protein